MNSTGRQRDQFNRLLQQIRDEVKLLEKKNRELHRENLRLKTTLDSIQKGEHDIFSTVNNQERIILKNQIDRMIERIDYYLEE
ncbi:MAG: hypothetical protein WD355_06610 [Balneolaceae bacterium]